MFDRVNVEQIRRPTYQRIKNLEEGKCEKLKFW